MPSKKRSAVTKSDHHEEKRPNTRSTTKAASGKTFFMSVIGKVEEGLQAQETAQRLEAKEKEWTYDPRPSIKCFATLSLVLKHMKSLGAFVDGVTKAALKRMEDGDDDGFVINNLLSQMGEDLKMKVQCPDVSFENEQLCAIAIYHWIDTIVATNVASLVKDAKSAKAVVTVLIEEFLKVLFTSSDRVSSLSIPLPQGAFDVPAVPAVEPDPKDSGSDWAEQFSNHMQWLFSILDGSNCHSIGRIKVATDYGVEKMFETVFDAIRYDDEDDADSLNKKFGEWISSTYAAISPTYCAELSSEQILTLCCYAILTADLNPRTYFGTYCFGTRESDYTGCRSDIAWSAAKQAEDCDNSYGLLQCCLMGYSAEDIEQQIQLPNTACFYVPGEEHKEFDEEEEEVE
jgi:hypothetical protein